MLKPKRKITRQEMKADPLLETIAQTEHFIKENRKYLTYGIAAVAVLILLSVMFYQSKRDAGIAANSSFGIAQVVFESDRADDAMAKFDEIIAAYPGTKGAGYSVFLEGKSLLDQEKYPESAEKFQMYIDKYADDDLLTAAAWSGLAICSETEKKYDKAAELFEKSAKVAPFSVQKQTAILNSVRNLIRSNDLGQAELLIKKVLDTATDTQIKNQAEVLSAQIEVLKG